MASPWDKFKSAVGAEVGAVRNTVDVVGDLVTGQGGQAVHDAAQIGGGAAGGLNTGLSVIPGYTQASRYQQDAYNDFVSRPLSTAWLATNPQSKDFLNAAQSYQDAQHVSPMQALLASPLGDFGRAGLLLPASPKDLLGYDPTDTQERQTRTGSGIGKFQSGLGDAALQWFASPTVLAGKAAKVGIASNITRPVSQMDLASVNKELAGEAGPKNMGLHEQIQFAENTTDREAIKRLPMVQNSTRRDLLTDALVHAGPGEGSTVVRAALGDRSALDSLWDQKAVVADMIESQTKAYHTDIYDLASGTVKPAWELYSPTTLAQHDKVLDAAHEKAKQLEALVPGTRGEASNSGIQSTITSLGARNTWIAQQQIARATRAGERASGARIGFWSVDKFQPSGFGTKVVHATWNHVYGEAPSGHLTLDGDQSFRASDELRADLNSVPHLQNAAGIAVKNELIQRIMDSNPGMGRLSALEGVERQVNRGIFEHYGLDQASADKVIAQYHASRRSLKDFEEKRGYVVDGDTLIKRPQLESQLANTVPIYDFGLVAQLAKRQQVALKVLASREAHEVDPLAYAQKAGYYAADKTFNTLRAFSSVWRPAVLLRFGFLVRNNLEGNLRSLAMTGQLAGSPLLGTHNLLNAVGDRISVNGSRFAGLDRQAKIYAAQAEAHQNVIDELGAQIDMSPSLSPDDLATLHQARDEAITAQAQVKLQQERVQQMSDAIRSKADYVTIGDQKVNLTYRNGTVQFDGAYGGPAGDLLKINTSADTTWKATVEAPSNLGRAGLDIKASAWSDIDPPALSATRKVKDHYWNTLAELGVKQFANDRVAVKLMEGQSPEAVHNWLLDTPDGRAYRKKMALSRSEADQHVMTTGAVVQQYFPDEAIQRQIASTGAVTAKELEKAIGGKAGKIHGRGLSEETGSLIHEGHYGTAVKDFAQTLFHYIGTMPEDSLTRHPFAAKMYEAHLNSQLRIAEQQGLELTSAEMKRMESSARAFAADQTIRSLYTIRRYSNFAEFAQYIMPFYAAWANTAQSWMRIIGNDPSVLARASLVWNAPNRMGIVYDQDGNQVTGPDSLDDNNVISLQMPGTLASVARVFGAPVDSLNKVNIPKGGLNVVTAGQPWYAPGFGPIVGIPVSQLVKDKPQYGQVAQSLGILMGGTPDTSGLPVSLGEALPAWGKRLLTLKEGQKNADYANTLNNINATEMLKWQLGQRAEKPTPNEIKARTDAFYKMRIAFALLSPTSATFQSPFQFYRDEYNRLQQQDPQTADQKFYEKYLSTQGADKGTAIYEFATQSLSRNQTGIAPSVSAVQRSKKYNGLVQDVVAIDPAAVQLVTNGSGPATFDSAAYHYEQGRTVSPGSGVQYRSKYAPAEAQADAQVQAGWLDYQSSVAAKNAELARRKSTGGSDSMNAVSNADLASSWSDYVNGLGNKNPAWWQAYNQRNDAGWEKSVGSLQTILGDSKFIGGLKDPTEQQAWSLVKDYMQSRQVMVSTLAVRPSTNIDANANADLKTSWDTYIASLTSQNPYFANIYSRFLESDKLTPLHGKAAA